MTTTSKLFWAALAVTVTAIAGAWAGASRRHPSPPTAFRRSHMMSRRSSTPTA